MEVKMSHEIETLFSGMPVVGSSRGPLGWSTVMLIRVADASGGASRIYLFDTGGQNERPALLERLAARGIAPQDVHGVILSHLHFDHAANWALFTNATVYIHPREIDPPEPFDDFAVPDFHRERLAGHDRLQYVEAGDTIDGMRVIEAPGHTQGLCALEVGPDVLASDAIKNRAELAPDNPLSNTWNREVARTSIARIAHITQRRIFPGHDVALVREGNRWIAEDSARERITVSQGVGGANQVERFDIDIAPDTSASI
jgi:glyoxylase-like metal-dependent hydrolase (beta-lactamase superfamily II)